MTDDYLNKIFENSEKAQFIEALAEDINEGTPKVIVIAIHDREVGFSVSNFQLGISSLYELLGILELGKQDAQKVWEE